MLSVIIPACNEAAWIGPCLDALLAQEENGDGPALLRFVEVVVAANACSDGTAAVARARTDAFAARGWRLEVLDIPQGGKPNALNRGDGAAHGDARVYLDADVTCGPGLLAALAAALDRPDPVYATGRLEVAPARSWITRRYAELWTRLPFMRSGAVGAGLFAVNAAGRARWGAFPALISDDTFVRVLFAPEERAEVPAAYRWPMVEGFAALVRVRRRQNAGVDEIRALMPDAMANEAKAPLGAAGALGLFLAAPAGFCVYSGVSLAVRLAAARDALAGRAAGPGAWARGR